ncbi:alkanesulfonate monooxygenase SsuD/methylene tetrahydromethanopterin reductase-like flavin-dependent oxidoreductase (luciferase family) [Saccharothrix tamanrassetensis]|uniref:Alkanesulfonate monooxygenase SsuD/methylene tetrahydromethanopterin reductase-like flavin-dependent oxidoreductase (Luciferase family) n=1 Tax=Saccharothrix tamanrassetensis TaxID=1051531 RepID=A0A841CNH3_9PSEU|nr:LLM class flavin-dependent oxidoreductase [Saccharothrix tamanrassetensis]MBB5958859.1 alkanesulfonate monooxygenase SsuD/methylene tetrahydromethanopterin reductase-like flavin-dependent oxidoreductase (luciferase family) [Saccharothrix tamanrassetensis]
MRTGIVILPEHRWWFAEPKWRAAEEYGFHHAWTYDHLGWRTLVDGPWFSAVPTLTAAAMVTERIRLGTFVASPNFRHPVPFARELLTLDDVSDGRFTLGVGAGGEGYDTEVLGEPPRTPAERTQRFGEFVELLDELLRKDKTTWHGKHFSAVEARSAPGAVQRPRMPFLVAANGPKAMKIAAAHGQGWVTTGPRTDDFDAWWHGVAELSKRFTEAQHGAGRRVDRYLNLDSAPVYSLTSVETFQDAVGRAEELGFTDVIVHWPRHDGVYAGRETVLEEIAAEVLPALG